jgi:4-amino-4-deoxy-L-arabinose transferase-like glycosyltransferase
VFLTAFVVRVIATTLTTVFDINPETRADAVQFANTAETIASGLPQGRLLTPGPSTTYDLWGAFLAPYWLVPGPSIFYARIGNAVLGAFAVYNVYVIASHYHSRRAGVLASFPMMFYPSFVAIHSTVLREAIVLFGITTAARLVLTSESSNRLHSYSLAVFCLSIAFIHRPENAVIYAAAVGGGLLAYAVQAGYPERIIGVAGLVTSVLAIPVILSFVRTGIDYLARTREMRASGRAVYLADVLPETIPGLLAFSWVGAAYFLYTPFPWMVETLPDLLISIEGMTTIGFTVAALRGVRHLLHRNAPATVALLVGFGVAVALYGVGTANYGTGMRHRQMFLWIVFLFGGMGIAEHVRFKWSAHSDTAGLEPSEEDHPGQPTSVD